MQIKKRKLKKLLIPSLVATLTTLLWSPLLAKVQAVNAQASTIDTQVGNDGVSTQTRFGMAYIQHDSSGNKIAGMKFGNYSVGVGFNSENTGVLLSYKQDLTNHTWMGVNEVLNTPHVLEGVAAIQVTRGISNFLSETIEFLKPAM